MHDDGKRCTICKKRHPLDAFNRKRASPDGLQSHCRECNRAASRDYYRRSRAKHLREVKRHALRHRDRNRAVLLEYLLEHPCVDCGESDPRVLEFDHVRGEKEADVALLAGRLLVSLNRLWQEIAKCEVRCVNCHRLRSAHQRGWWRGRRPSVE